MKTSKVDILPVCFVYQKSRLTISNISQSVAIIASERFQLFAHRVTRTSSIKEPSDVIFVLGKQI